MRSLPMTLLLFTLFLVAAPAALSADEIVLFQGEPIECDVVELGPEQVLYRPLGSEQTKSIKLRFIQLIRYEDGRELTPAEIRQSYAREEYEQRQEQQRQLEREQQSADKRDSRLSLVLAAVATGLFVAVYLLAFG